MQRAARHTASPIRPGRAVLLVRKLLDAGVMDSQALAEALVVTPAQLAAYVSCMELMPLDRQLCLAQLLVERVSSFARAGRALRGQVAAAMAFESGVTPVHRDAPVQRMQFIQNRRSG